MFLFVFILGLAIGSFLNVLIERLPKEESILGRSKCPKCDSKLNWQDLLPVFSFFILKGRCRNCGHKISIYYPIVEVATALLFLVILKMSLGWFMFFLIPILIVLFFSDIKYFILPDKIILSGAIGFLIFLIINNLDISTRYFGGAAGVCALSNCSFQSILLGSAFLGGLFLLMHLISSGKWVGFGDVKLGFFLGAFSGFYWALNIFYLAITLGVLASVIVLFKGGNMKTSLPFGAFLTLAAAIAILFRTDFVGIILRF